MIRIVALIMLVVAVPLSVNADDTLICPSLEVKVCFADGTSAKCHCRVRNIQMSDTVEQTSSCVDENDDGICD